MFRAFGREILICFFVGTLPVLVVYMVGSVDNVLTILNGINPGDPIVLYSLGLLFIHILVYFVDKYILKLREAVRNLFTTSRVITHQIGFSLHGVYRAFAGAVPAAIAIMLYEEDWADSARALPIAVIFFLGCLFVSCFLTWLAQKTKPRECLFSDKRL